MGIGREYNREREKVRKREKGRMKSATISELRARLSEYIRCVKSGEEILVTERGKPVARLVPVGDTPNDDARRMDLIRRGILRPGKGKITREDYQDLPLASVPDDVIRRIMDEEREDRA
jgi:prevent-host-death family protein